MPIQNKDNSPENKGNKNKGNKNKDNSKTSKTFQNFPMFEQRCRNIDSILEFYLTELNGINVIIKVVMIGIFFKIYLNNKLNNKFILGLLVILTVQVLIHISLIIVSLPFLCDSSKYDWKYAGKINNPIYKFCTLKSNFYYSNYFWFFDSVLPNLFLLIITYYILQKGYKIN